jgi:hypothetical protein
MSVITVVRDLCHTRRTSSSSFFTRRFDYSPEKCSQASGAPLRGIDLQAGVKAPASRSSGGIGGQEETPARKHEQPRKPKIPGLLSRDLALFLEFAIHRKPGPEFRHHLDQRFIAYSRFIRV